MSKVKETLTDKEIREMILKAEEFRDAIAALSEPVYIEIEETPITNKHHVKLNLRLRKNSFIVGILNVEEAFVVYAEKFFGKDYQLQFNNNKSVISVWLPK